MLVCVSVYAVFAVCLIKKKHKDLKRQLNWLICNGVDSLKGEHYTIKSKNQIEPTETAWDFRD